MQTPHRERDLGDCCPLVSNPAQVQLIKILIYVQMLNVLYDLDVAVVGCCLTG